MKDKSLTGFDGLPEPDELARRSSQDLEVVIESLREICDIVKAKLGGLNNLGRLRGLSTQPCASS